MSENNVEFEDTFAVGGRTFEKALFLEVVLFECGRERRGEKALPFEELATFCFDNSLKGIGCTLSSLSGNGILNVLFANAVALTMIGCLGLKSFNL